MSRDLSSIDYYHFGVFIGFELSCVPLPNCAPGFWNVKISAKCIAFGILVLILNIMICTREKK